ncbi:hypothetical protein SPRG_12327 [Saprolegnia parasitica CBS 223.65]|uniref:Uncharacterized protein n=1 Tax=Saprolegnia parasitica (strain CBS 223.65) TaxID=695850 RepID=A0A067C6T8_SAPPC|nr:hypothetical protein SPRG_12327 [Saprolegnia parasitica CBS 223.65]KDO22241.1 hypothetical protein SPRG_12327 [Saprolegnia parasitica CBS 223.65]|eukprot:XP_012207078.1 hypothetical protein SPRG_12327 [Saprolegnia parasitica CBS 223.65]
MCTASPPGTTPSNLDRATTTSHNDDRPHDGCRCNRKKHKHGFATSALVGYILGFALRTLCAWLVPLGLACVLLRTVYSQDVVIVQWGALFSKLRQSELYRKFNDFWCANDSLVVINWDKVHSWFNPETHVLHLKLPDAPSMPGFLFGLVIAYKW